MTSGIYCITNTKTGDCYVGKAKDLDSRWKCHVSQLNRGVHQNPLIQSNWDKHDKDIFTFKVLEEINLKQYADIGGLLEVKWIEQLKPSYNRLAKGKVSQEVKDKIRAANKKYWDWRRANNLLTPKSIAGISWKETKQQH